MKHQAVFLFLLAGLAGAAPRIVPVPADPLELASGRVDAADRTAALGLLARARDHYSLRKSGLGYDLKVSFAVDSAGQTRFDGTWQMEDRFLPGQGLHWNAQASAGYSYTGIATAGAQYGDGDAVPLRLEEVRGMLLHPLPSDAYLSRESIRSVSTALNGAAVTCLLLTTAKKPSYPPVGRAWEEAEECIDPQTGLLMLHSEAPGRYIVYDYTNAPKLDKQMLARTVTVHEGGRAVSTITVDLLEEMSKADRSLFVPSDRMRQQGRSVEMAPMTKMTRAHPPLLPFERPVCVFGLVSASGQLLEAHSLQPSDPNSQAALNDARQIDFSKSTPPGTAPRQHFVVILEKFGSR